MNSEPKFNMSQAFCQNVLSENSMCSVIIACVLSDIELNKFILVQKMKCAKLKICAQLKYVLSGRRYYNM